MTTDCQNRSCKRPSQLYLCNDCTEVLRNMLEQVPWLLDELDARIQNLDRVPHGTIGRTRGLSDLSVMDFAAAETAREVRKQLRQWVETIAQRHTGRIPPGLDTIETKNLARWLYVNVDAIARLDCAGEVFHDINKLVGSGDKGGKLVGAINRNERHFAGPCPTIRGYDNDGDPIECGQDLYAQVGERHVDCPACHEEIDVEKNQAKASADRDLMTADGLIEVLDNIGEPIQREQLDGWITSRRLRRLGWLHQGGIVQAQVRKDDLALFSFQRARKLRRRDAALARQEAAVKVSTTGAKHARRNALTKSDALTS